MLYLLTSHVRFASWLPYRHNSISIPEEHVSKIGVKLMKSLDLTALYWNFQQTFRLYIEEKVPDPTGGAVTIVDLTVFLPFKQLLCIRKSLPVIHKFNCRFKQSMCPCVFEMPLNVRFCLKQAYRWYMTVLSKTKLIWMLIYSAWNLHITTQVKVTWDEFSLHN